MDHPQAPEAQSSKRIEPQKRGRTPEHCLHPLPAHPPLPRWLLVLQPLDFRLIIANGVNLCAEHDGGEGEEEDSLQAEENEEHDGHRRGEITALAPLDFDTGEEMEKAEAEGMQGN